MVTEYGITKNVDSLHLYKNTGMADPENLDAVWIRIL